MCIRDSTYNHRLKLLDPKANEVNRWIGSGKPGLKDGKALEAQFSEPSGFALGPDAKTLYVADTNNHVIRVVDLDTLEVRTLNLSGIPSAKEPIAPAAYDWPNSRVRRLFAPSHCAWPMTRTEH